MRGVTITGPSRELVEEARAIVRDRSPEPDLSDAVQVAFWRWGDHGAHETTRALDTPSWPEIRPNYASDVRARLDELMKLEAPTGRREAAALARRARHREDHRHPLAHPRVAQLVRPAIRQRSRALLQRSQLHARRPALVRPPRDAARQPGDDAPERPVEARDRGGRRRVRAQRRPARAARRSAGC